MSFQESTIIRAIDANANRCREGVRVLEDVARFLLNDCFLTEKAKNLRHTLEQVLAKIPPTARAIMRDTLGDVGTVLSTEQENRRPDASALVVANSRRVAEALRCLEEFTKYLHPETARQLKELRYQAYTLEKALLALIGSKTSLEAVHLYVLIGVGESEDRFCTLVRSLVDAGVDVLQLRAKNVDDCLFLARARLLRRLTAQTRTLCIINDRPDIAAVVNADGVHLGQEDMPAQEARKILGPEKLIGISTHSLEQAEQAVLAGANYIGVGPIFPSKTKHFETFPGLELARAVASRLALPAFAIGGITLENLHDVLATGIGRVAVASAIVDAEDPAAAACRFKELLTAFAHRVKGEPSAPGEEE